VAKNISKIEQVSKSNAVVKAHLFKPAIYNARKSKLLLAKQAMASTQTVLDNLDQITNLAKARQALRVIAENQIKIIRALLRDD